MKKCVAQLVRELRLRCESEQGARLVTFAQVDPNPALGPKLRRDAREDDRDSCGVAFKPEPLFWTEQEWRRLQQQGEMSFPVDGGNAEGMHARRRRK